MSIRTHLPATHPAVRINREVSRWAERDQESRFLLDGSLDHLESARANVEQALKDARTVAKWNTGPWKKVVSCFRLGNNAVDAVLHGVSFGRQVLRGEAPDPTRIGGKLGTPIPPSAVDDYVSDLKARMRAAGTSFPDTEIGGTDGLLLRSLETGRFGHHDDGRVREIWPETIEPLLDFLAEELKAAGGDERFIAGIYWLAANHGSYYHRYDVINGVAAERFVEGVKATMGTSSPKPKPGAIDPKDVDAYVADLAGKLWHGPLHPDDQRLVDLLQRDRPANARSDTTRTMLDWAAYRLKAAQGDGYAFLRQIANAPLEGSFATGPRLSFDAARLFLDRVKAWSAAPPESAWDHPSGYDGP